MTSTSRRYEIQEASFDLGDALKDKTMNVFTLTDDGPSEYNLVITRAPLKAGETLTEFSNRMVDELRRALPKFQLRQQDAKTVDGEPAVELHYGWVNNGISMSQRQTTVFVSNPGDEFPCALMIAGTCQDQFTDAWNQSYDQTISSVKLRHKTTPIASASPLSKTDVAYSRLWFALHHDHQLYVLVDEKDIYQVAPEAQVLGKQWKFYDNDGHPMEIEQATPYQMSTEPGRPYRLKRAATPSTLAPLATRLALIDRVEGRLTELMAVHQHLQEAKGAGDHHV